MTVNHLYPTTRPTLDLNFARQKRLDPRVTFTRGSTATYVGDDGLIKTAASNEARFDHDPATGESLGLLVEESRTNLVTYSEQLDDAYWIKTGTVTADSTLFVDGNTTAELLTASSTEAAIRHNFNLGVVNAYYTFSVYVKKNTSKYCYLYAMGHPFAYFFAVFDLDTGICTQQDTRNSNYYPLSTNYAVNGVKFANGYYRLTIVSRTPTYTSPTFGVGIAPQGTGNVMQTGGIPVTGLTAGDSIYLGGAQLEAGSFTTSYIPTSGSTVTRSVDLASMTGTNFSSWYNQTEGTWFVNYEATVQKEATTLFEFHPAGQSRIFSFNNSNRVQFQYGGPFNYSNTATISNDYVKAAMFYESDGTFGGSFEGTAVVSAAGTSYTATQLKLAPFTGASGAMQSSTNHVSRLTYYPTRLTDSQLQELTR